LLQAGHGHALRTSVLFDGRSTKSETILKVLKKYFA